MELPARKEENKKYNNINCRINEDKKTIKILLDENKDCHYLSILQALSEYKDYDVTIGNIFSIKALNGVINSIQSLEYDGNVTIDLLYPDRNRSIEGLDNYEYVIFEKLPSYAKLHGFYMNNAQNEFSTWAHNLSNIDKISLVNYLDERDIKLFNEQESIIDEYYARVKRYYNQVLEQPNSRSKFEVFYKMISDKYVYDGSCLTSDGTGVKPGMEWSRDAAQTYYKSKGVCEGRANLLTLLTNNQYFGLKCTTVDGKTSDGIDHSWNQFIDEKGNVLCYDMSFGEFNAVPAEQVDEQREVDREYYVAKKNKNKSIPQITSMPPLPPRKVMTYKPLPPRKEN